MWSRWSLLSSMSDTEREKEREREEDREREGERVFRGRERERERERERGGEKEREREREREREIGLMWQHLLSDVVALVLDPLQLGLRTTHPRGSMVEGVGCRL